MKHSDDPRRTNAINRRAFLGTSLGALGLTLTAPGAKAGALRLLGGRRREGERTLVIIQLNGGNDVLSTLVPYADDEYHRVRKSTKIDHDTLFKVDDYRGFHPKLRKLSKRFAEGEIGVIQGAGYPGPNRSHFKSREIWHTADLRGRARGDGWAGRLCATKWPEESLPELSVHIGPSLPFSLHSATHPPVAFNTPDSYQWLGDEGAEGSLEMKRQDEEEERRPSSVLDHLRGVMSDARGSSERILEAIRRYETPVDFKGETFSQAMLTASALIHSGHGSRVISVTTGGFDTHAYQKGDHATALEKFDDGLDSFLRDVRRCEAGGRTLVVAFSEFGRRVQENGSGGTDHGKAGLMFVAGDPVRGGLYGKYPSLTDLDDKDLRFNVDFRDVYATATRWMGGDVEAVLDRPWAGLDYLS